MGLDITAYRKLTKLDAVFDADGDPINPETREALDYDLKVYANFDFPGREDGLEDRAVYSAEDSMGFRAGSYGGYNAWREELAKLAGYPLTDYTIYGRTERRHDAGAWAASAGPFWELINFSDCEGIIGPVVSEKLAKDFAEFDERAKAHAASRNDWFYPLYQTWRQAFDMAADGGAVDFH